MFTSRRSPSRVETTAALGAGDRASRKLDFTIPAARVLIAHQIVSQTLKLS